MTLILHKNNIFESDETVTLTLTDAWGSLNGMGHYNVDGSDGTVTILQGPEFISDTDKSQGITKDNILENDNGRKQTVNGDNYAAYVKRNAEKDDDVLTVTPIFTAKHRPVTYSFYSNNQHSQSLYLNANGTLSLTGSSSNEIFKIDADTGKTSVAQDFEKLLQNLQSTTLPNTFSFNIRASDAITGQRDEANVTANLITFDLDIDSDNNNELAWPDNSDIEELLENDPYGLGKLVLPAYEAEAFTPIRLRLPPNLDPNNTSLKIRFDFDANILGCVNIFTADKGNMDSVQIISGIEYALAELNYTPSSGGITLYLAGWPPMLGYDTKTDVDAAGAPPSKKITAKLLLDGKEIGEDIVKYLVASRDSFYYEYFHNEALRAAVAADKIYDRQDSAPYGLNLLDGDELQEMNVGGGASQSLTENASGNGFNAGLYREGVHGLYLLAFAGTDDFQDVIDDIWQGLGNDTDQYVEAMGLANLLRQEDELAGKVTITGHSLGGGLASAAACVSGFNAFTFNAAGLHSNTIANSNYGSAAISRFNNPTMINAYYSEYDLLSALQDYTTLPNAIGTRIELDSEHDFAMVGSSLAGLIPAPGLPYAMSANILYAMTLCHNMSQIYFGMLDAKDLY